MVSKTQELYWGRIRIQLVAYVLVMFLQVTIHWNLASEQIIHALQLHIWSQAEVVKIKLILWSSKTICYFLIKGLWLAMQLV